MLLQSGDLEFVNLSQHVAGHPGVLAKAHARDQARQLAELAVRQLGPGETLIENALQARVLGFDQGERVGDAAVDVGLPGLVCAALPSARPRALRRRWPRCSSRAVFQLCGNVLVGGVAVVVLVTHGTVSHSTRATLAAYRLPVIRYDAREISTASEATHCTLVHLTVESVHLGNVMPTAALAHPAPSRKPRADLRRVDSTARAQRSVHVLMGQLIGISLQSEEDVLRLQQRGMPAEAFERLVAHLPAGVDKVVRSRSSMCRRMSESVLSDAESERALRVTRTLAQAIDLFEDQEQAKAWLTWPAPYVSGQPEVSPLELCVHESGAKIIENRLLQTQYGIF